MKKYKLSLIKIVQDNRALIIDMVSIVDEYIPFNIDLYTEYVDRDMGAKEFNRVTSVETLSLYSKKELVGIIESQQKVMQSVLNLLLDSKTMKGD